MGEAWWLTAVGRLLTCTIWRHKMAALVFLYRWESGDSTTLLIYLDKSMSWAVQVRNAAIFLIFPPPHSQNKKSHLPTLTDLLRFQTYLPHVIKVYFKFIIGHLAWRQKCNWDVFVYFSGWLLILLWSKDFLPHLLHAYLFTHFPKNKLEWIPV